MYVRQALLVPLLTSREMGQRSPERKKDKRSKQKVRRKLFSKQSASDCSEETLSEVDHTGVSTEFDCTIEIDPTVQEDADTQDSWRVSTVGDVDIDLVDMNLYDSYRRLDGQAYTQE